MEMNFWDGWLAWFQGCLNRLKPDFPMEESSAAWICEYLEAGKGRPKILDVGAGPLTVLGKRWKHGSLDIVPVDPLAEAYARSLKKHRIEPAVPTLYGDGEKLTEIFPENHFDLAYANNAVDHSQNPLECIRQMIAVVKPGRYVLLEHKKNEAQTQKYTGLHFWNFSLDDEGRPVIWRKKQCLRLREEIQPLAKAEGKYHPVWKERVLFILQKREGS